MNEDPLTVTLTQISQLVVTLNKKNVAQSSRQINQVKCAMKVTYAYIHSGRPFCPSPFRRRSASAAAGVVGVQVQWQAIPYDLLHLIEASSSRHPLPPLNEQRLFMDTLLKRAFCGCLLYL